MNFYAGNKKCECSNIHSYAAAAAPAAVPISPHPPYAPLHTNSSAINPAYPTWLVNLQCLQQLTHVCGCVWCMCTCQCVCVPECMCTVCKHCAYFLIECAGNWLSRTWAWSWLWAIAIVAYSMYLKEYQCVRVSVYVEHMCLGSALACLATAVTVTFKQFFRACVCVLWIIQHLNCIVCFPLAFLFSPLVVFGSPLWIVQIIWVPESASPTSKASARWPMRILEHNCWMQVLRVLRVSAKCIQMPSANEK